VSVPKDGATAGNKPLVKKALDGGANSMLSE